MDKIKLLSLIKTAVKGITVVRAIYGLVIILLAVSAIWGWYFKKPQVITVPTDVYVPVPQIQEVIKVKTVYVDVGKVQVLDKAEAIKKLGGFPEIAATDPNKQITSTGVIPPYKGRTNVVNVIDTKSGVSEIMAKRIPLPFMAIEQERYAGVRIGSNGNITAFAEWGFGRIGKAHIAAYGQHSTEDNGEIGVFGKIEF